MTTLNNPNVLHHLACDDKEITLIGTAHVSKESVDLVKSIIEQETPDTVAVELCPSRFQTIKQKDQWREMDIIKVIKEKKAFLLLANFMLASFQKRIAAKLDIKPGAEMIQAIESGEAVGRIFTWPTGISGSPFPGPGAPWGCGPKSSCCSS